LAEIDVTAAGDVGDQVGDVVRIEASERLEGARQRANGAQRADRRFNHPLVGPLALGYENFTVNGTGGQMLTVYHAEPRSASEQALTLLSSMIAPAANDRSPPSPTRPNRPRPAKDYQ
jgi:hypothetical protein